MNENLPENLKAHLISLGCSKNLVDSESMLDILIGNGFEITKEPQNADIILINTCGFIESAKKEAIDKILEMSDYKKSTVNDKDLKGQCDFLIVTGCLGQRYYNEIKEQIPEVDAILGTAQYENLPRIITGLYKNINRLQENRNVTEEPVIDILQTNTISHLSTGRTPSTKGYAYIKVAEGCSNRCSYCAIPGIRGDFISRPMEDLVKEAENISLKGIYEILLIAQDTTGYGKDIYGTAKLPELIREISAIENIRKIRLLYCYADGISDELIEEIKSNNKVAKYIEMPIQHADNNVLSRMNRRDTAESIEDVITKLKHAIPDITIRTTVLVGFPGETPDEFNNLAEFIKKMEFDLLGCFVFSPEEGTPSYKMKPKVPKSVAEKRYNDIMIHQKEISFRKNKQKLGTTVKAVVVGVSNDGIFYLARGDGQCPEIDPYIYVAAESEEMAVGREYDIKIIDVNEYELIGVCKQ